MALDIAFKEWSAVCDALADGRQTLLFRKGGIAETGGVFRPDYDRFWLFPTHFHEQQHSGLKPGSVVRTDQQYGVVRLSHFAAVNSVHWITDLDTALSFDAFHIWNCETIRQRFHYRTPGLYLFDVTVWHAGSSHEFIELPEYAGCKTWVPLKNALLTSDATPVLSSMRDAFQESLKQLDHDHSQLRGPVL